MKNKIAKLIDVKSIITIALVAVLCIETLRHGQGDVYNSAVMLVLGFFFGKKVNTEEGHEM